MQQHRWHWGPPRRLNGAKRVPVSSTMVFLLLRYNAISVPNYQSWDGLFKTKSHWVSPLVNRPPMCLQTRSRVLTRLQGTWNAEAKKKRKIRRNLIKYTQTHTKTAIYTPKLFSQMFCFYLAKGLIMHAGSQYTVHTTGFNHFVLLKIFSVWLLLRSQPQNYSQLQQRVQYTQTHS